MSNLKPYIVEVYGQDYKMRTLVKSTIKDKIDLEELGDFKNVMSIVFVQGTVIYRDIQRAVPSTKPEWAVFTFTSQGQSMCRVINDEEFIKEFVAGA